MILMTPIMQIKPITDMFIDKYKIASITNLSLFARPKNTEDSSIVSLLHFGHTFENNDDVIPIHQVSFSGIDSVDMLKIGKHGHCRDPRDVGVVIVKLEASFEGISIVSIEVTWYLSDKVRTASKIKLRRTRLLLM